MNHFQGHIHTNESRILVEAISIEVLFFFLFLWAVIIFNKIHNEKGRI